MKLKQLTEEHEIHHQMSYPHTSQQNGVHRHIVETCLVLLFQAKLPYKYWVDSFLTATFFINRMPYSDLKLKSRFEIWFQKEQNCNNLKIFGCKYYPYLIFPSKNKFDKKTYPCVLIGYNMSQKEYRCLDPKTNKIYISRHVIFDENYLFFL